MTDSDAGTTPVHDRTPRTTLGWFLLILFALAMLMGPGPGILLIRPVPGDPEEAWTLLGLPTVYAWGIIWFAVQASVIVLAYLLVWRRTTSSEEAPPKTTLSETGEGDR